MYKRQVTTLGENVKRAIPELNEHRRAIDELYQRLSDRYGMSVQENKRKIEALGSQLRLLDFSNILTRGFAYIQRGTDGLPVRSSQELTEQDIIRLTFNDGDKSAQIL